MWFLLKSIVAAAAILLALFSVTGLLIVMALFHKIITTPKDLLRDELYMFSSKRWKRKK